MASSQGRPEQDKTTPASSVATSQEGEHEIVITSNDVLFGQGGHTNVNEGNFRYRAVVGDHKKSYSGARKNGVKHGIAQKVVNIIHARGGRFLKWKKPTFVLAEDEAILTKVKTALRTKSKKNKYAVEQVSASERAASTAWLRVPRDSHRGMLYETLQNQGEQGRQRSQLLHEASQQRFEEVHQGLLGHFVSSMPSQTKQSTIAARQGTVSVHAPASLQMNQTQTPSLGGLSTNASTSLDHASQWHPPPTSVNYRYMGPIPAALYWVAYNRNFLVQDASTQARSFEAATWESHGRVPQGLPAVINPLPQFRANIPLGRQQQPHIPIRTVEQTSLQQNRKKTVRQRAAPDRSLAAKTTASVGCFKPSDEDVNGARFLLQMANSRTSAHESAMDQSNRGGSTSRGTTGPPNKKLKRSNEASRPKQSKT